MGDDSNLLSDRHRALALSNLTPYLHDNDITSQVTSEMCSFEAKLSIHRVKSRHGICGHDTIAILWV